MTQSSKFLALILTISIALAACTSSEPDEAAEPTEQPTATVEAAPTSTATELPSATEAPATVAPTADVLGSFIEQLETAVTGQDYSEMQALMSDPIGVGTWRSEWRLYQPVQAAEEFQSGSLPAPTAVQFTGLTEDQIAELIGQPPADMLGPTANTAAVLHSTGWGLEGADDALLFVVEEDDAYTWSAFLYTTGSFADAFPGSVAAPIGLIYRVPDASIYQIQLDGEHLALLDQQTADIPGLQISTDGLHAAYLDDQGQLWLIDTATGDQQQLAAEFSFAPLLTWADEDTLFAGVWLDPSEADGPNNGHTAALDINTGDLQIFDEQYVSGSRPALLSDYNRVAFAVIAPDISGRTYHPDSGLQIFDQSSFEAANELLRGSQFNPAWAPDGVRIAWLTAAGDRTALQIYDLEQQTALQIYDWDPARFGGLLPSPFWSPDGMWLALEILANGPEGSGLWLLAADGSEQRLVDTAAYGPHWINPRQLVFNKENLPWLYDLDSDESYPMDLPDGSQVLNFTDPESLLAAGDQDQLKEAEISYVIALQDVIMYSGPGEEYSEIGSIFDGQTALVTGVSMDEDWWRVICPDDTVGSCWVPADPEYTQAAETPDAAPTPDPSALDLADEQTVESPDGLWQAVALYTEPVLTGDIEQYYASLSVSDGETVWTPIAEWRNYGLGYDWPAVYRWSPDSSDLYYTNKIAFDGCRLFSSGDGLYRLDVLEGEITEILPSSTSYNFALSPDESTLAYTTNNGQQVVFVTRDVASGEEQSVAAADTGDSIQTAEIFWSPDGSSTVMALIYDACLPAEIRSIVYVDVDAMTASTILEKDDRGFTISGWSDTDELLIELVDKDGVSWILDISSGNLSSD